MSKDTPCIHVCVMDAGSGLCRGCGRTLDEIAHWSLLASEQRLVLMSELPARMQAAGLPDLTLKD